MKGLFTKAKHVGQRMLRELSKTPIYYSEFGLRTSIYMVADRVFLRPKSDRYRSAIYQFLETELRPILQIYQHAEFDLPSCVSVSTAKIPVWFCWFQGYEKMPELVQMCYKSLRRNVPNFAEVRFVSLKNIKELICLDEQLWQKFENGTISFAFFSDIIRYHLLRDYGGLWIDSTVYVSGPIPSEWFSSEYYTIKMPKEDAPHEACEGLWTNFCFSGKQNDVLFRFVCDGLNYYWKGHGQTPDYVFLDYIIMAGYQHVGQIRNLIDSVPYNNLSIWEMKNHLCRAFCLEEYIKITSANIFHKLAHQIEYPRITFDGKQTFYGYLLEKAGY